MDQWIKCEIGDLCNTISETYRGNDEEVILINTSDVLDGKILNHKRVKNEKLKGQFKKTFLPDDILYSEIRPANRRFAYVDVQDTSLYIASTKLMVLRCNTDIVIPKFLFAILTSQTMIEELQLRAESRSGTFPQITFGAELAHIKVNIPDKETQLKIVSVLESFQQKLETNNKINRNLEEQARVVFNSWFVKFEPFNEPMMESPIGYEVPESLELVQISSLEHILETGRRPKGGAVTEGIPSVGAESVKGIGNFGTRNIKFIPEDFAAKLKTGAVKGYELMIYKDGGKPGEFHPHFSMFGEGYPFEKFFINEHVFKLDFGNRGYNEFAYFYFQTDYVLNWLESNGGKAAIPGINQNVVKSIWIFKPNHPKVKEYCEWVQPLFTQIFKNCYANMQLSSLRDTLLPKLMSGELDVSELEF